MVKWVEDFRREREMKVTRGMKISNGNNEIIKRIERYFFF